MRLTLRSSLLILEMSVDCDEAEFEKLQSNFLNFQGRKITWFSGERMSR